jgi:hypothetical protein
MVLKTRIPLAQPVLGQNSQTYKSKLMGNGLKNLNGELESVKTNLEQSRLRVKELGDQKRWIDWISKHQDKMSSMRDMTIENRKEYLDGILDKISVTLGKNQQHQLSIWLKYPIVGDSHEWDDPKTNRKVIKSTKV